jgi:hypothetical protein
MADLPVLTYCLVHQVPLWFGVALKKRKKCRIKVPDWLYDGESRAGRTFSLDTA